MLQGAPESFNVIYISFYLNVKEKQFEMSPFEEQESTAGGGREGGSVKKSVTQQNVDVDCYEV